MQHYSMVVRKNTAQSEKSLIPLTAEGRTFAAESTKGKRLGKRKTNMNRFVTVVSAACISIAAAAQTADSTVVGRTGAMTLTVDSLFSLVEQGSTALRVQRTGIEAARLGEASAVSQRLPDINVTASVSYNGNVLLTDRDFGNGQWQSSPHFGNSFSVEARQLLYSGGAVTAAIRLARLQRDKAETDMHSTREQVRFMALSQYLDLYKIGNSIEVVRSNIALTETLIGDIKARQEQGMALQNDVTRYELQLKQLQLQLTKLENQRSILSHSLCNTLGVDTRTEIVPSADVVSDTYGISSEDRWHAEAQQSSPSLKLASLGTQKAMQDEKQIRSELLPKISLVAADNFNGPITYELPPINKNINVWYFGIGLTYNVSSLFKSNKKLSQSRTATLQSRQAHALAAEELDNNVQQAYTQYRQSYVELETQQQSVKLAVENYRVVSERYLNQLSLITDMLDASAVRLDAELREVDARINVAFAYYRLKYIAGTL